MSINNEFRLNWEFAVRTITELSEFEKLKTEWDCLASKQSAHKPFLCFDWFKIWFETFFKNFSLFILLLYKDEALVGIAPFMTGEDRVNGIKSKKIVLAGNVYSPIRYFLFDNPENAETYVAMILEFLREMYKDWDVLDFYGVPEENAAFDVLSNGISMMGLKKSTYSCFGNMYIDNIDYSGEEYLNRRPGNISKNVPYRVRRLQRLGPLEFKLITDCENLDHYMDAYYELYSRSWQKEEHIGPTFHRSFATMAAMKGWLRLGFLFFNGAPIACQFWIVCDGYAYILKLFYDQYYQQYAPGKILTSHIAKHVIDVDKARTIDFDRGEETYKKDWTPKRRERKGVIVFNANSKGHLLAFVNNTLLPLINRQKVLRAAKDFVARQVR